jgi:transcriptional regulator with PAS, ATPase and Fis domain
LLTREYPGNVRDLKQLVARIVNHHVGAGPVTIGDIPEDERLTQEMDIADWRDKNFEQAIQMAVTSGIGLKDIGRAAEDIAERIVLGEEQGNLQRAASRLGVTDRALQMRRAARRQNGHLNGSLSLG